MPTGKKLIAHINNLRNKKTPMNTIDKANQLANNPNLGATVQFLNDPNTLSTINNAAGAANSLGNSTVTATGNLYDLGTTFTQADYDQARRLAELYR